MLLVCGCFSCKDFFERWRRQNKLRAGDVILGGFKGFHDDTRSLKLDLRVAPKTFLFQDSK